MGASASSGSTTGVDITQGTRAPNNRWWAGLVLGGKLYGVPCNAEHLLIYDPASTRSRFVETKRIATGEGKWRAAAALGSKIYGVPDRADHILIYDLPAGHVSGVDVRKISRGPLKWQSAVVLGGKVYGIPHHATKLLVYDPEKAQARGVDVSTLVLGNSKWLAGAALGARVIGVPCNADLLLVYDPAVGKCGGVSTSSLATGPFKWLAAVTLAGRLYAVPCHAECILVFDSRTGMVSSVDTTSVAVGPGKWTSAVVCDGKIYGIPDHANSILVFDPATQEVTGVDISHLAEGKSKWQNAAVLGGKIYAMPFNAEQVLVFDPRTNEARGIDSSSLGSGAGKWGMAASLNGKVCGLPWDAANILVHEPPPDELPQEPATSPVAASETVGRTQGESEEALQEPETGFSGAPNLKPELGDIVTQDFIAAWISEWIYFVNDTDRPQAVPPMRVEGDQVSFQVHAVMDDPLQGSPARLGVVTATLPSGDSVIYLVFKGSSFLNDLVANSCVAPDFTPFNSAFGDQTTFIHHGAYHAIAQLKVQQWLPLREHLSKAWEAGTRQLVVTGHSLGGQYALSFMLQVFLEHEAESQPLLRDARCAVFGAPMCYGSVEGADVRQDLADFFLKRSVVYVCGGDPAPRLWSELDLEDFMHYFVDWIHGRVSGLSRRLIDYAVGAGGLAQKAQDLLQRPDIEKHLLRPAARYVHLSRIRFLGKEFREWRPLGQSGIDIGDHSLSKSYIPGLCAAFDPSDAGGLWDEQGRLLVDETGHVVSDLL